MVVIIAIVAFYLQKFEYKIELSNIELIRIIGLDSEADKVRLTYLRNPLEKISGGGSLEEENNSEESGKDKGGAGNQKPNAFTIENSTYNTAMKEFAKDGEKIFTINAAKYYLIGENTARNGILQEADFLSRRYELRLDSKVFIAKNITAEELLEQADSELYVKLDNIMKNTAQTVHIGETSLINILDSLNSNNTGNVVPVLQINEETGTREINVADYAIFKKDKLIDYLLGDEVLDYSILKTNVKGYNFDITNDEYGHITLCVTNTIKSLNFEFDGDNLKKVKYKIRATANIEGMDRQHNLSDTNFIEHVELMGEGMLRDRLYNIVNKEKELKTDFLRVSDIFDTKHPNRWEELKENWDEVIGNTEFEVEVDFTIMRTYDIKESTRY